MKAVVLDAVGRYAIEDVSLDPPRAGEVRVKMKAAGVCHTDVSLINGSVPFPTPMVIGHEGAGIVEELGEGVTALQVGDHVVLSCLPMCGECNDCVHQRPQFCTGLESHGKMMDGTARVHRQDGSELNVMQCLGCMAEYAVVPVASAIRVDSSIPLDKAVLVGCGVITGVGAVMNTAHVEPGASVVVFGCGGVGLSIIQGARLVGAGKIIAVDLADNKLELARKFGATHCVNPVTDDAMATIADITGGGADYAFEAVGLPGLMGNAYDCVRRGGTAVVVGVGNPADSFPMNAYAASMSGKTLKGSFYGDANPPADFPRLLQLYQNGQLNLDDMVSKTYSIDQASQAFADLESNANARGVIVFD